MMKCLVLSILFFIPFQLMGNDDIREEVIKLYWRNCALDLLRLCENPPDGNEINDLIARMVRTRALLNNIDWSNVEDPGQILALLETGD